MKRLSNVAVMLSSITVLPTFDGCFFYTSEETRRSTPAMEPRRRLVPPRLPEIMHTSTPIFLIRILDRRRGLWRHARNYFPGDPTDGKAVLAPGLLAAFSCLYR
jgi:hypothetical protein